jgi:hypothetical protein
LVIWEGINRCTALAGKKAQKFERRKGEEKKNPDI